MPPIHLVGSMITTLAPSRAATIAPPSRPASPAGKKTMTALLARTVVLALLPKLLRTGPVGVPLKKPVLPATPT